MRFSRVTAAAVAVAVLALGATSGARASVLWNNGGPVVNSGFCSSNAPTCQSNGWTIYDDFKLTGASTVTGFTYDSDFNDFGSSNDYTGTNWSIWSSDPRTSWSSGPLLSGTSVGVNSADSAGYTLTTVTGLNLHLAPGTYWIGLQNNVDNGQVTGYVTSGASMLGPASQSDNSGTFFNPNTPDASFTIEGMASIPEPATWALMLFGVAGVGAALRRRHGAALTAA